MKKLFVSVLCITMAMCFMPGMAWATDSSGTAAVAKIGDTEYTTFAEAYEKVSAGGTITLLTNTEWVTTETSSKSGIVNISKKFTLDLGGFTLETVLKDSTKGAYINLKSGGDLTIIGQEDGCITTKNTNYLVNMAGGNLTLEGGILHAPDAKRTIYVKKSTSVFSMTGGILKNHCSKESDNNNVLEIKEGIANISGGSIISTENVPCAKVSGGSGTLNLSGIVSFETGADHVLCSSSGGKININQGNYSVKSKGTFLYVTESKENIAVRINETIPSLRLSSTGIVAIGDAVKINNVSADENVTSFKIGNDFTKGIYENDFTNYIIGNGLVCNVRDDNTYTVAPLEQADDRVVATIRDKAGNLSWFGDFGVAMKALENGDTLELQQDVANHTTSRYMATASNVTIDLNGHDINAEKATALYFNPTGSSIQAGDEVRIIGSGEITGLEYGIYASVNKGDLAPAYTISLGSNVCIKTIAEAGSPVELAASAARLYMENRPASYTPITTSSVKTVINGKEYIYTSPSRAINDLSDTGGTVELIGDSTISSSENILTNQEAVVFDLNGHTLTLTGQNGLVSNGNDLTIQNGTIEHTYARANCGFAIGMDANGKSNSSLTLKDVAVNVSGDTATALTVNGTLKNVKVKLENSSIQCAGSQDTVGIYFPVEGGTLDIIDTQITAKNAVQLKGGTTTVCGNKTEITSTGAKGAPQNTENGCTNTGDGIYMEDTYGFHPVLIINEGMVKSSESKALNYYQNANDTGATGKIEACGGIFSSDVQDFVPADKTEASITSDRKTSYHVGEAKDVAEQLSESAKAGDEITVQKGDLILQNVTSGVKVANHGEGTVSVNHEKVEENKPVITTAPTIPYYPTVQNPTIEADNTATVTLSDYGTKATIKPADGYELVDVTVNGVSKGKVDTLTGLKTGDKVVVTTKKIEAPVDPSEEAARIKAGVENTTLKIYSGASGKGEGWIQIRWVKSKGFKIDGYELYRGKTKSSMKKYDTTRKTSYKNARYLKKGNRYYYKVRGYRMIGGEKVYTKWSKTIYRIAK